MAPVLFDLDGTLLDCPSSERLFVGAMLSRGMLGPRQIGAGLGFLIRWAPRYRRHVFKKNKAYLAGLDPAAVSALGEDFVRRVLLPRVRPSMRARIDAHGRAGDRLALLTGAPDFLAAPLARAIGLEAVAATRCAVEVGRFNAAPPPVHPFGHAKIAAAGELCRPLGGTLEEAVAYADSGHDVPLLCAVARPVAVAPDRTLARIARAARWEIVPG